MRIEAQRKGSQIGDSDGSSKWETLKKDRFVPLPDYIFQQYDCKSFLQIVQLCNVKVLWEYSLKLIVSGLLLTLDFIYGIMNHKAKGRRFF